MDGATERDLVLSADDEGATLRATVIATTGRAKETARSAASAVVADRALAAADAPAISETPAVGELLTAAGDAWEGIGPFDVRYRWQRCDATGHACANIRSAVDELYAPTESTGCLTARPATG